MNENKKNQKTLNQIKLLDILPTDILFRHKMFQITEAVIQMISGK